MEKAYKIIDMHVHIAGRGDVWPDDLWWSQSFEKGIGFAALKILKGWGFRKVGDRLMKETLTGQTAAAERIDAAVVLALDSVYDPDGTYRGPRQPDPNRIRSTIYVSNRFVTDLCKTNPRLLPGISVHPFRPDALEELDRYKDNAVLCKWMPSAQLIDFEDIRVQDKLDRFYAKLVEIRLPLLLHTGVETSIPTVDDRYEKYNNPRYIERALDMGVVVILAHCGCSYFDLLQDNVVDEVIRLFLRLQNENKNWNLYADISALFSPFRKRKILDEIFTKIPVARLVYGSDFPNPAKGRREFILRPFLRYSFVNLLDRSEKISEKWLTDYFSRSQAWYILVNFHRLLDSLGRGHLVA